jgi:hypothetical protein
LGKDILVWLYKFANFNYDKTFCGETQKLTHCKNFLNIFLAMRQQKLFFTGNEIFRVGMKNYERVEADMTRATSPS